MTTFGEVQVIEFGEHFAVVSEGDQEKKQARPVEEMSLRPTASSKPKKKKPEFRMEVTEHTAEVAEMISQLVDCPPVRHTYTAKDLILFSNSESAKRKPKIPLAFLRGEGGGAGSGPPPAAAGGPRRKFEKQGAGEGGQGPREGYTRQTREGNHKEGTGPPNPRNNFNRDGIQRTDGGHREGPPNRNTREGNTNPRQPRDGPNPNFQKERRTPGGANIGPNPRPQNKNYEKNVDGSRMYRNKAGEEMNIHGDGNPENFVNRDSRNLPEWATETTQAPTADFKFGAIIPRDVFPNADAPPPERPLRAVVGPVDDNDNINLVGNNFQNSSGISSGDSLLSSIFGGMTDQTNFADTPPAQGGSRGMGRWFSVQEKKDSSPPQSQPPRQNPPSNAQDDIIQRLALQLGGQQLQPKNYPKKPDDIPTLEDLEKRMMSTVKHEQFRPQNFGAPRPPFPHGNQHMGPLNPPSLPPPPSLPQNHYRPQNGPPRSFSGEEFFGLFSNGNPNAVLPPPPSQNLPPHQMYPPNQMPSGLPPWLSQGVPMYNPQMAYPPPHQGYNTFMGMHPPPPQE